MLGVFSYILIFATFVLFGYNLFRLADSFDSVKEKILSSRSMVNSLNEDASGIRCVNTVQNILLVAAYTLGAYLAGFANWTLALIVCKLSISCAVSDKFFRVTLNVKSLLTRPLYRLLKFDALTNALLALFILCSFIL